MGWIFHRDGIWGGYSSGDGIWVGYSSGNGIWGGYSKEKEDFHAKLCIIMIVSIFQLDRGFWGRVWERNKSQNPRIPEWGRLEGPMVGPEG